MSLKCIAVLTRGYTDIQKYDDLIKRNHHIGQHLRNKSIPNLIFHEGNITTEHQSYIRDQTPELTTVFIDVTNVCFQPEKKIIPFEEADNFNLGYRHMCSFWFVNFFDVVHMYDKLLRIDEDCFVTTNLDDIFEVLDSYSFVTATCTDDHDYVTKGLNQFSLDFIHSHPDHTFKQYSNRNPHGPYTNFIGFSLKKIGANPLFQEYRKEVDATEMIYKRRWGDLPLWGEVIYYIFGEDTMKIDTTIQYFHGSHNCDVNADPVSLEDHFVETTLPILPSKPALHGLKLGQLWSNPKSAVKKNWNLW